MTLSILTSDNRRIEEDGLVDGVAGKPQHVQEREVRCESLGCFALIVEDGLRIEGDGPGGEVEPATKTRQDQRTCAPNADNAESSVTYREAALASWRFGSWVILTGVCSAGRKHWPCSRQEGGASFPPSGHHRIKQRMRLGSERRKTKVQSSI